MRGRIISLGVLMFGLAGPAAGLAQSAANLAPSDDAAIAVPPAPAIVAAPPSIQTTPVPAMPSPPGLVAVAPPANIDSGGDGNSPQPPADAPAGQGPGATPAPEVADIAPVPPNTWLPAKTAKIGVLDKIDGSVAELSILVGSQSVVGDLQVNVQACMTRPPDQVPDAAVFLALQNRTDPTAAPSYRGWLVRSAPGAAVAGDASETFRVIDCS
jgi:hypothetical protein